MGGGSKRPHRCSECQTWHHPGRSQDDDDPAKGETVPRCLACGSPNDLVTFEILLSGRHVGSVLLCGADYYRQNPIDPQVGDPLRAA